MDSPLIRRRVVVHGMVQGVFFRDTCRREASRHHVSGWVRNNPDGTVEVVFEGAADDVNAMVGWAKQGPSAAEVTHVDISEEPVNGITGFRVRPG